MSAYVVFTRTKTIERARGVRVSATQLPRVEGCDEIFSLTVFRRGISLRCTPRLGVFPCAHDQP